MLLMSSCQTDAYYLPLQESYQSIQGSRLTLQLGSPVASARIDSLAKTNFSLARRRHLLLR